MIRLLYKVLERLGLIDIVYYLGDRPHRKYMGDAGFDLYVSKDTKIEPKNVANVPVHTVVTTKNCWLLLVGRSSTLHKKKLQVMTGIIDNGYTNYLNTCIFNPNDTVAWIKKGERISQVIPFKRLKTKLLRGIQKPSKKGRHRRGFGSTGY